MIQSTKTKNVAAIATRPNTASGGTFSANARTLVANAPPKLRFSKSAANGTNVSGSEATYWVVACGRTDNGLNSRLADMVPTITTPPASVVGFIALNLTAISCDADFGSVAVVEA